MVSSLLRSGSRPSAFSPGGFYGWRVVALAGFALGMTAPGQTIGVSVFVDPLIADLGIARSTLSTLYLVATLAGALALPVVGRLIDTWGTRWTMTAVASAFGLALLGASRAAGIVTLTLAFIGLRMFGQGSLTLTATTSPAFWFERRRGLAVGVTAAGGQGLMSLAPVALSAVIVAVGWRNAWLLAGAVVLGVLVPLSAVFMRDRPASLGQRRDGDHRGRDVAEREEPLWGLTRRQAVRTGMFWTVTAAVAANAMIGTGLTFHQISILGQRGFDPAQAAAVFIPMTLVGVAATFGIGWLVDRVAARVIVLLTATSLAAAMVAVQHITPGVGVVLYAAAIGISGGAMRNIEGAVIPEVFGTRHLGDLRGTVMVVTVMSSAFGPLAIAAGEQQLGSYPAVLNVLLVIPAAVTVAALVTRNPRTNTA